MFLSLMQHFPVCGTFLINCGWDKLALKGFYLKGLSEELKDKLAFQDKPDSLGSLIALAIKVDNRLRE